jgi:hypothetical protein
MGNMDYFVLPKSDKISDFELSQEWFETRERCRECGINYNRDLDARNKKVSETHSWDGYYDKRDTSCPNHKQSLEDFLTERRNKFN